MAIRLSDDGFGGGKMDSGLSGVLSQALAGVSANKPGGGGGSTPQKKALSLSDLENLLLGTAREWQTTQKSTGPIPYWVPNKLRNYVKKGVIDPYLGTGRGQPGQADPSWRVYLGREKFVKRTKAKDIVQTRPDGTSVVFPGATPATTKRGMRDKTATVAQAMNEPYQWDADQVASAIKRFQDAGMTDVQDFNSLVAAWGGIVSRAGSMYSLSSGKRKVTPWDVLDLYRSERAKAGTLPGPPGPGDPGFNGSTTVVNKTIADVDEGQAWDAVRTTMSNMLGRDPSDQEVRDFTYRMSNLAARNPSISKTIQQYKDGQVVSSTTKQTDDGFSAADMAKAAYDRAQSDPDYAEYQSATTYFNAAVSALGAIGG